MSLWLVFGDMVVWNEFAVELKATGGGIVEGYPYGPTNLPMWGSFCGTRSGVVAHAANSGSSATWFGHKMLPNWERRILGGNYSRGSVKGFRMPAAMASLAETCTRCRLNHVCTHGSVLSGATWVTKNGITSTPATPIVLPPGILEGFREIQGPVTPVT